MNDPRLTAYVLDELEPKERKEVEMLLQQSSEARIEVEKIRRMTGRLREELGVPPPSASDSSSSMWKGLTAAVLSLGIIVLVAGPRFLWGPGEPKIPKRTATILLDPPVATNLELNPPKRDEWSLEGIQNSGPTDVELRAELSRNIRLAKDCYNLWQGPLGSAPQPGFNIKIGQDGHATIVSQQDDQQDRSVTACLEGKIKSWRFSKASQDPVMLQFRWVKGK